MRVAADAAIGHRQLDCGFRHLLPAKMNPDLLPLQEYPPFEQLMDKVIKTLPRFGRRPLGDPYENPYPARAVLLVDDQADAKQEAALRKFAQQMGGELLKNVEQVIPYRMELIVNRSTMAPRCFEPPLRNRADASHRGPGSSLRE